MWEGQTVGVILPTYREKSSIRDVIAAFEALGVVDEIVVVNNNAEPGTSDEVATTSAREVFEHNQGYGAAIRRGIAECVTDLVCVCEPDGTFEPADLWKLLAYARDFEFVYGSRTVPEFIWSGANMGTFLRWGNWAVAKMIEMLFNTSSLSDVGCTLRVARGEALRGLQQHFTVEDGAFGPEMMLLSIIGGWRMVQVPVNYRARRGLHGTTDSFETALQIGLQMIVLVTRYRGRRGAIAADLAASGAIRPREESGDAQPGGEPSHMFPRLRRRARASSPLPDGAESGSPRDDG
jgi:glycosyltransferase involved in cell wall biosynthesis